MNAWSSLDGDLEVDVDVSVLGNANNVGQLASQSSSFIEIINGKNLQSGRTNHDLSFIHVCALKLRLQS